MKIDRLTPRDAASIIIYKKKKNKYYVLMGGRSIKSKFMPSIYVFPGGSVDKIDYKVNNIFNLSANIKKIKLRQDLIFIQKQLCLQEYEKQQRNVIYT